MAPVFILGIDMRDNGKHLKVKIYKVDFDRLCNTLLAETFLFKAVQSIGMRELDYPKVYDIKETLEAKGQKLIEGEEEGVSGVIVLSTSHVTIHTWPHRGYAMIDVYSCTQFDDEELVKVINEVYDPVQVVVIDISESLETPEEWEDMVNG